MGSVATRDARVTGGLEVGNGVARLINNTSVTAYDRAAPVALSRGGHVLVCSTSDFHLLHAGSSGALIFGLDRGAFEIYSDSQGQDVILTPDLKLTPVTKGFYDLRVRVTREGDTCVQNDGAGSPVLNATDAFSSSSYRILPGQHLLFVGGDLHKVVDHERSSCGCPDTLLAGGKPLTGAAAAHPFPTAQSEGLAPEAASSNAAPAGTAGSQMTTTFSYDNGQGAPPPTTAAGPGSAAGSANGSATASAPKQGGFFHAIGHFFHRLFHPS